MFSKVLSPVSGTGFGFTVTTSVVVVGYNFEKYRGLAIGISVAATGAGMFACGPIFQLLIDSYSIRGAFLLIGGIYAQFFVFGAMMRPSGLEEWHKDFLARRKEQTGKTEAGIPQRTRTGGDLRRFVVDLPI